MFKNQQPQQQTNIFGQQQQPLQNQQFQNQNNNIFQQGNQQQIQQQPIGQQMLPQQNLFNQQNQQTIFTQQPGGIPGNFQLFPNNQKLPNQSQIGQQQLPFANNQFNQPQNLLELNQEQKRILIEHGALKQEQEQALMLYQREGQNFKVSSGNYQSYQKINKQFFSIQQSLQANLLPYTNKFRFLKVNDQSVNTQIKEEIDRIGKQIDGNQQTSGKISALQQSIESGINQMKNNLNSFAQQCLIQRISMKQIQININKLQEEIHKNYQMSSDFKSFKEQISAFISDKQPLLSQIQMPSKYLQEFTESIHQKLKSLSNKIEELELMIKADTSQSEEQGNETYYENFIKIFDEMMQYYYRVASDALNFHEHYQQFKTVILEKYKELGFYDIEKRLAFYTRQVNFQIQEYIQKGFNIRQYCRIFACNDQKNLVQ